MTPGEAWAMLKAQLIPSFAAEIKAGHYAWNIHSTFAGSDAVAVIFDSRVASVHTSAEGIASYVSGFLVSLKRGLPLELVIQAVERKPEMLN